LLKGVGGINKIGKKLKGVSGSTMRCGRVKTITVLPLLMAIQA